MPNEDARTADVLVIGGGPAGSMAALCIQQAVPQASIVIVDKATFPRDKACGDAVGPIAVNVFRRLGLESTLFAESARISKGRLIGPDGIEFIAGFSDSKSELYGYIQPRAKLDSALIDICLQRGITVEQGQSVEAVVRTARGWEVKAEHGEAKETTTWQARIVVGADGAASLVRKSLGIASLHGRTRALAIRAYATWSVSGRRLDDDELLVVYDPKLAPVYGWVFPLVDGTVNVGVGYLETDRGKGDPNLRRQLDVFTDYLKSLGFELVSLRDVKSHTLPLGNNCHPIARDGAFLIGDAAGMINPLSGEGIAYLARAAEILAEELAASNALTSLSTSTAAVERAYEDRFRSEFRVHFRENFWATRLLSRRSVGKAVFLAAQRSEAVRTHGVNLMFGDARLDPRSMYLIARSLIGGDRGTD